MGELILCDLSETPLTWYKDSQIQVPPERMTHLTGAWVWGMDGREIRIPKSGMEN